MSSTASLAVRPAAPLRLSQILGQIPPALLLVPLAFLLFFLVADRITGTFAFIAEKGPLGSDTREGAEFMLRLKYEWKHPLAGLVTWAATAPFRIIPGVGDAKAMALGLATLATLNLLAAHAVARRLGCDGPLAILATACFAFLLSTLIGLSLTDTYTVSCLMALLVILLWLKQPSPEGWRDGLRLGGLLGLAGLSNPPLLLMAALPAMHTWLTGTFRRAFVVGLRVSATALLVVLVVALTQATLKSGSPLAYLDRSATYTDRYGEVARLAEPGLHAEVGAAFLAFSVAAPTYEIPDGELGVHYASGYVAGPGGLLGLAALALMAVLAGASLLGRHRTLAIAIVAWLVPTIVFYVYFFPPAAMLYTVQTRPALLVLLTLGALSLPGRREVALAALLALAICLGLRNVPVALDAPYGFTIEEPAAAS